MGDTVTIEYLFPTIITPYGLSSTGTVTPSGLKLDLFGNDVVTVYGSYLAVANEKPVGTSFTAAAFNGLSIEDDLGLHMFTSFAIDPTSNIAAFTPADISISGGLLYLNLQGIAFPVGGVVRVDFTTSGGAPTVPEPSTLSLLLLGAGFVIERAQRKCRCG